jgi:cytochrome bd-type quinol oxidase subunit 2
MWIKLLLIALLLFIVFNLFRALYLMLKNDENLPSMSKFLGRRVWWSAIVLILVILALQFGLISPHHRPY